ncbi:MAG: hypothetical protein II069_02510 [Oscillospiraceae bacterium]|nr:hypothetical protein [Oscillospiraceae bacterium]
MEQQNRQLRWMRLDNAALIFPAAQRKHWSNAFRLSFTFRDPVDPALLQQALDHVAPRFPSVCVRLRRSTFWYYLEEVDRPPAVREDSYQPLVSMGRTDIRRCAIRVLYYRSRMAVEFFHAVTDGTGGMVFAKTLAAEYVRLRYGADVPATHGVLDIRESPKPEELEDSFQRNVGPVAAPRDDGNVYRYRGTLEPDRFLHVTLGTVDSEALHSRSHALGVTVTAYLTAVLLQSLLELQAENVPRRQRRKNVKIQIPVNLRKLYDSRTMRNFVAVANVGVDPRLGDYTLEELAKLVHHQMHLSITPKNMQAIFTPNVTSEQNPVLKIVPLFLKNIIMRAVFDTIGERVASMTLSNLGRVELPEAMAPFVERVEFVLGPQSTAPYNASVTSWQGKTFINIVRNTVEPRLEEIFFTKLVKLGCRVTVESNDRA